MDADGIGAIVGAFAGAVGTLAVTARVWLRSKTRQREIEISAQLESSKALRDLVTALSGLN